LSPPRGGGCLQILLEEHEVKCHGWPGDGREFQLHGKKWQVGRLEELDGPWAQQVKERLKTQ
jgi:hypothetical protein